MTDREMMTKAAKYLQNLPEYNEDICCVDSGRQASDPVMIYGQQGWTSTPFQNAGFRLEYLVRWLHAEGGCCTFLADIGAKGSAEIYRVSVEETDDGDGYVTRTFSGRHEEDLPDYCWLDQDMVVALLSRGATFHGGDIPFHAEEWLDNDFDAEDAGRWMDAGVFNASAAKTLQDEGVEPDEAAKTMNDGFSLGYRYANKDLSLQEFFRALRQAPQNAHEAKQMGYVMIGEWGRSENHAGQIWCRPEDREEVQQAYDDIDENDPSQNALDDVKEAGGIYLDD